MEKPRYSRRNIVTVMDQDKPESTDEIFRVLCNSCSMALGSSPPLAFFGGELAPIEAAGAFGPPQCGRPVAAQHGFNQPQRAATLAAAAMIGPEILLSVDRDVVSVAIAPECPSPPAANLTAAELAPHFGDADLVKRQAASEVISI